MDANYYSSKIFRPLSKVKIYDDIKSKNTNVINMAEKKAENKENKSAITIALEDFTEKLNSLHEQDSSNITRDDVTINNSLLKLIQNIKIFLGIDKKDDNIFAQKEVYSNLPAYYYQNDIYKEEITKHGGVQYAKEGDDLERSAINFAYADIDAINKAYDIAHPPYGSTDDEKIMNSKLFSSVLDRNTISTCTGYDMSDNFLNNIDLDGNPEEITPREYASYILTVDGIIDGQKDGLITKEEAEEIQGLNETIIKETVQKTYDNFFNNK